MDNIDTYSPDPGPDQPDRLILVTGANGFVGGRLVPRLLEKGYQVRCLVRNINSLSSRPWYNQVDVISGDVVSCKTLVQALEGVNTAYYLIHNMTSGKQYKEKETTSARNFGEAAAQAKVEQIVYLGGLADPRSHIGKHMRSRLNTGEILRESGVQVTEFRASLIIGSGSISFEMIRFMTEQLPIIIGPRWLNYRTQPISIIDILEYLLVAIENPLHRGKIYEIGGSDILKYADTMRIYAEQRGLRRPLLISPFLPVNLMAFLIDKMTPVRFNLACPLLDGMQSDSIVNDQSATLAFPNIKTLTYKDSVISALNYLCPLSIVRNWDDEKEQLNIKHEGFLIDARTILIIAPAEIVYQTVSRLGGKTGWLYLNWLWRLRGWMNRILGGPGMRGRTSTENLQINDHIDFYKVESLVPGKLLRLHAELFSPGEGWMEWQVKSQNTGKTILLQTAFFAPKGFWGFCYWYIFSPFHRVVFKGLLRAIGKEAVHSQNQSM